MTVLPPPPHAVPLQTLLVCFLRASASVEVREGLWDSLLEMLQSLTNWQEVITQWKVRDNNAGFGLWLNGIVLANQRFFFLRR